MRLLVTGAGGLLGGRLAACLAGRLEVVAACHRAPGPPGLAAVALDLLDAASIEAAVARARPDVILHCAALADADRCEREPELAWRLNVGACESLARVARRDGIRVLAVSTDLVFGGARSFAREEDATQPLMTYARTKLAGEQAVLAEAPGSAVLRVALIAGQGHGPRASATEAIAWTLAEDRPLRLYTDQFRTPLDADSAADAVARLCERPGARGVFHLGGPERLSRHALGLRVAQLLGLPQHRITPTRQADQLLPAPRPADVSLDSGRARRELGWLPRGLDVAIRAGRPTRD